MKNILLLLTGLIPFLTGCQETYSLDSSHTWEKSALLVYDMSGWFTSAILVLILVVLIVISSRLKDVFKELQIGNGTNEDTESTKNTTSNRNTAYDKKTYSQIQEERKKKELDNLANKE